MKLKSLLNIDAVLGSSNYYQEVKWSESCSVLSDSLRPYGLYSPWKSPGQNTGVDSLSLLQRILPTQGLNRGLPHCTQILYQLMILNFNTGQLRGFEPYQVLTSSPLAQKLWAEAQGLDPLFMLALTGCVAQDELLTAPVSLLIIRCRHRSSEMLLAWFLTTTIKQILQ